MEKAYKAALELFTSLNESFKLLEEAQCLQADCELERIVDNDKLSFYQETGLYTGKGKTSMNSLLEIDKIHVKMYETSIKILSFYDYFESDIKIYNPDLMEYQERYKRVQKELEETIMNKQRIPNISNSFIARFFQ